MSVWFLEIGFWLEWECFEANVSAARRDSIPHPQPIPRFAMEGSKAFWAARRDSTPQRIKAKKDKKLLETDEELFINEWML
jgi:hypothetical protein